MFLLSTVLVAQQNIDNIDKEVCRDPATYLLSAAEMRVMRVANNRPFLLNVIKLKAINLFQVSFSFFSHFSIHNVSN